MPVTAKHTRVPLRVPDVPNLSRGATKAFHATFLLQLLSISYIVKQSYNRMERAKLAAHKAKQRWHFLRECLAEQVLPKSMQHLTRYNSNGHPFPQQQEAILLDQIAAAHREKQEKFAHLHHCKRTFRRHSPRDLYLQGLALAHEVARRNDEETSWKHRDIIRRLCKNSPWASASHPIL